MTDAPTFPIPEGAGGLDASPPVEAAVPQAPATDAAFPPPDRYQILEMLKDNIEAFTIALVMALVIKHFCVEAFKIPTGSMLPTLRGESSGGVGDRILVDKWAYLITGPDRWDVIVFRFPLNRSKHFIKRVASVGNEWIRIERGDLWVRPTKEDAWRIATKRRRVRDELYIPVFPPDEHDDPDTWDQEDLTTVWEAADGWTLEGYDRMRFEGEAPARLLFLPQIGRDSDTSSLRGYGRTVRDVRFRFRFTAGPGAVLAVRWATGEESDTSLELTTVPDEPSRVSIRRPGRADGKPLPGPVPVGQPVDLELECVDGEVHLLLDGRQVAKLEERRPFDQVNDLDDFTQTFEITASGGTIEIEDLQIDRDIDYEPDGMRPLIEEPDDGLFVPDGHYFVLGDNTDESHDSRKWSLSCVPLTDGREIRYYHDTRDPPRYGEGGRTTVFDEDGVERSWLPEEEDPSAHRRSLRSPFVARELVVGRAFYIFWPVLPDFPGRAGFIH